MTLGIVRCKHPVSGGLQHSRRKQCDKPQMTFIWVWWTSGLWIQSPNFHLIVTRHSVRHIWTRSSYFRAKDRDRCIHCIPAQDLLLSTFSTAVEALFSWSVLQKSQCKVWFLSGKCKCLWLYAFQWKSTYIYSPSWLKWISGFQRGGPGKVVLWPVHWLSFLKLPHLYRLLPGLI